MKENWARYVCYIENKNGYICYNYRKSRFTIFNAQQKKFHGGDSWLKYSPHVKHKRRFKVYYFLFSAAVIKKFISNK